MTGLYNGTSLTLRAFYHLLRLTLQFFSCLDFEMKLIFLQTWIYKRVTCLHSLGTRKKTTVTILLTFPNSLCAFPAQTTAVFCCALRQEKAILRSWYADF